MQNNSHRKCGQALYSFSSYTDSSVNFVGGSSTRQFRHLDPDPVHSGSKPQVPLIRHLPSVKPETPLTKLASKATKVKSISNSLNVMMIRRQLIGITWNFELFSTTVITKFLSTSQKTQISSNGLLLKFGQWGLFGELRLLRGLSYGRNLLLETQLRCNKTTMNVKSLLPCWRLSTTHWPPTLLCSFLLCLKS